MTDTSRLAKMGNDIFLRIIKRCFSKNDFSVLLDLNEDGIPDEYKDAFNIIRILVGKGLPITLENVLLEKYDVKLADQFIRLMNDMDRIKFGIVSLFE